VCVERNGVAQRPARGAALLGRAVELEIRRGGSGMRGQGVFSFGDERACRAFVERKAFGAPDGKVLHA
jgi:hypothetical protein